MIVGDFMYYNGKQKEIDCDDFPITKVKMGELNVEDTFFNDLKKKRG